MTLIIFGWQLFIRSSRIVLTDMLVEYPPVAETKQVELEALELETKPPPEHNGS